MAYNGPWWPLVLVAAFIAWLTAAAGPVGTVVFLMRFAFALLVVVVVVKLLAWFMDALGLRRASR